MFTFDYKRKHIFWCAIGLCTVIRIYLLWQNYCISSDGVHYIDAAKHFHAGDVLAGLSSVYPPGYPLLIAATYPLTGNWEMAGQIPSVLMGVLLLVPLYRLFCDVFNDEIALIACFLAALSPLLARYAAHVRSESPFLFLSTVALVVFNHAIQRQSTRDFFIGGLISGFAYLIRPEAIGLMVIVPAVYVMNWLRVRTTGLSCMARFTAAMGAGFLIFALPYIVYLSIETGRWGAVSRKAGITLAISMQESGLLNEDGVEEPLDVGSVVFTEFIRQHPLQYLKKVIKDSPAAINAFFEALHYSYVLFLLAGLYLVFTDKFWLRRDFLLLAVVLFYLAGFIFIYVKRRYSLQVVPISLGWVALGWLWLSTTLNERLSPRAAHTVFVAVILLFLAVTLPKTLKPISREKANVRNAGLYLHQQNGSGNLKIAVFDDRISFYAGATPVILPLANFSEFISEVRKAHYLATETRVWHKLYPEVAAHPESYGLLFEKEFSGRKQQSVLIFRVA